MRLYSTLTRQLEEVEPLPRHRQPQPADQPDQSLHHQTDSPPPPPPANDRPPGRRGTIGLYACGPTVYDYTHLGHLRKYTLDDVLVRTLRHAGFDVKFVQNVTDVGHLTSDADSGEDKLETGAKKYGRTPEEIARQFEDFFFYSMDLMGNLRPDISCRATEHIAAQLELVKTLEKKGFTYIIEGDGVYFDTSRLDDYGRLARLRLDQLQAGARVEQVKGKRQPSDFALWKFERPGENRAMVWPSPWAERGFPGWHIECSAMSMCYLGDQFEIHTGGIDHIPVHHVNEIAQSEAATGAQPFVRIWVHHNFLLVESEKMSKSLGNFLTIDSILERGFAPQALRLLFLSGHYRSELNFTWQALEASSTAWRRLVAVLAELENGQEFNGDSDSDGEGDVEGAGQQSQAHAQAKRQQFWQFLEDDLKTPEAMAVMWEVLKDDQLTDRQKLGLLFDFDQALGLRLRQARAEALRQGEKRPDQGLGGRLSTADLPDEVIALLEKRATARAEQDWATGDQLRDQLADQGYRIIDEPDGSQRLVQSAEGAQSQPSQR